MEITRTRPESMRGPAEHFTGEVWLDPIVGDGPPESRTRALFVTEGVGRAQTKGGDVEAIRAGDTIRFEPDEEHWHGASLGTFMTHLALQEVDDDGNPAYWGEHVTDEQYGAEPG